MKAFDHVASPAILLALLLTVPAASTAEPAAGFVSATPSELKWSDAPGIGPGVKPR